jgi:putative membrane protein
MFKYHTLKYTFDDKGVSMSWGVLFHREIYLTYRRIQDIHVTRNLFHRWLGLAAVAVQTASGSSGAEMTIEGIRNPESLRDFLYQQMRGARGDAEIVESEGESVQSSPATTQDDEALILLRDIRDELRAQRERIQHGDHGVHRAESE